MSRNPAWTLTILDPSGETRSAPLKASQSLGRDPAADVVLRDPTSAPLACRIWAGAGDRFWVRAEPPADGGAAPVLGYSDFRIREAEISPGIPLRVGETRIVIERRGSSEELPETPRGVRPWVTLTPEGRAVIWNTRMAAGTPLSIYLAGETGTGKEVLARLVHAWSERASGPFVPLHCGALSLGLAESELFGHTKGAFTGAERQRPGALLQAHGGTLFLDEVGDLPLEIQVKLLRFLEDGEIRPVGSDHRCHADVRVVCATHKPLQALVEEGRFRRDLYFRLASVTIEIPPLRTRPADVEHLALEFARALGRTLSERALLRLQAHSWPGNVRELRHAVERAIGLSGPHSLVLDEGAFEFLVAAGSADLAVDPSGAVLSLHEMERVMLLKALRLSEGNRRRAAQILGVARSTLFEMLRRHRIQGPRKAAA